MSQVLMAEVFKRSAEAVSLSITIPAYNRRDSVLALVRAAREQAGDGDEVIVSDDGSTDGTCGEANAIPGVKVIRHQVNQGMVPNWNECLTSAARDWICLIHDDDRLKPGALAALRRACALANGPALILHRFAEVGEAFRCSYSLPSEEAVLNCPTIPSGAVLHREIIEALGPFDLRFKYSADLEYFARIASRFPLIVIESPQIVEYRLHGANYQLQTWRRADFCSQLEEIQRLIISYAGIGSEERVRDLLRQRMTSNLHYMVNLAAQFGDRELVRHVARECDRFGGGLSARQRIRLRFAAMTGLLLRLR